MTTMTAVYDALIAGDIPAEKATAAVEAIEVARDDPWKRKTKAAHADLRTEVQTGFARLDTRIARLEVLQALTIVIITALLVPIFIKTFFG